MKNIYFVSNIILNYYNNIKLSKNYVILREKITDIFVKYQDIIESNLDILIKDMIGIDKIITIIFELVSDVNKYPNPYEYFIEGIQNQSFIVCKLIYDFFGERIDIINNHDAFRMLYDNNCNYIVDDKIIDMFNWFQEKTPLYKYYTTNRNYNNIYIIGIKIGNLLIGCESFDYFDINNPDGQQNIIKVSKLEICSICINSNSNIITRCNHNFCNNCLHKWFNLNIIGHRQNTNCPCCRQTFIPVNRIELIKN